MNESVASLSQPSWDDYYMTCVFVALLRSPDPATKHGAILVDKDHTPVSFGYNGPPRNMKDNEIPWDKRPEKYFFSIHAEDNAFKNGGRRSYEGCTLYVSGFPCQHCWLDILQYKVSRVVYGSVKSFFGIQTEYCTDANNLQHIEQLLSKYKNKIELIHYKGNIVKVLFDAILYYANRVDDLHVNEISSQLGEWNIKLQKLKQNKSSFC